MLFGHTRRRQRQDEDKGECSTQATPKQDVLIVSADRQACPAKDRTERIDRSGAAQQHQHDRHSRGPSEQAEDFMRLMQADQDEDQGICQEGDIFPNDTRCSRPLSEK